MKGRAGRRASGRGRAGPRPASPRGAAPERGANETRAGSGSQSASSASPSLSPGSNPRRRKAAHVGTTRRRIPGHPKRCQRPRTNTISPCPSRRSMARTARKLSRRKFTVTGHNVFRRPLRTTAHPGVDVERDGAVLGLFGRMPPPDLRDPRIGSRERRGAVLEEGGGEGRGQVLERHGDGKLPERRHVLAAPLDALEERPLQLAEVVAPLPAERLVVGLVDAPVHRFLADESPDRLANLGFADLVLERPDRVDEEALPAREAQGHGVEERGPERVASVPVAGKRLVEVERGMPRPDGAAAGHSGSGVHCARALPVSAVRFYADRGCGVCLGRAPAGPARPGDASRSVRGKDFRSSVPRDSFAPPGDQPQLQKSPPSRK